MKGVFRGTKIRGSLGRRDTYATLLFYSTEWMARRGTLQCKCSIFEKLRCLHGPLTSRDKSLSSIIMVDTGSFSFPFDPRYADPPLPTRLLA